MLLTFAPGVSLADLFKAYVHGHYRRHPKTGQQVWVDSYSDKRPERHRTEFAHWQHRIEHFKDHLAHGRTREALHAFHDLGHDDSHKLARDLGLHDDGPEFADKKTLMGAVHGRILARKQALQAQVGAQVKADFEKRKAAGTVGKKGGKAPKELAPEVVADHPELAPKAEAPADPPKWTWNDQDGGAEWARRTEKQRQTLLMNHVPGMETASGRISAEGRRMAGKSWDELPDSIRESRHVRAGLHAGAKFIGEARMRREQWAAEDKAKAAEHRARTEGFSLFDDGDVPQGKEAVAALAPKPLDVREPAPAPADPQLTAMLKQYAGDKDVTPAELTEANRQYQEVKARYQGTPGWLKAPNGKPSKLNERQWVLARTENFKNWFGDFEAAALQQRINRIVPMVIDPSDLAGDTRNAIKRAAVNSYAGRPEVTNRETGNLVKIAKSGLDNALQHGMGPEKIALLARIDDLIETATLAARDVRNMRPGVLAVETYAVPVVIAGQQGVARLVVREVHDGRRFYDHELSALDSERPDGTSGGSDRSFAIGSPTRPSSSLGASIVHAATTVKPDAISKVLDANGEPLIAYHGSGADISGFDDQGKSTQGEGLGTGLGHFFATSTAYASDYAKMAQGNVIPTWLAIKQPLVITDREGLRAAFRIASDAYCRQRYGKTLYDLENSDDDADYRQAKAFYDQHLGATDDGYFGRKNRFVRQQLQAMGYDGIVFKNDRQLDVEGGEVLVAFTAPQVKSSVGNAGTFRPDLVHLSKAWPRTPIFFRHARSH